MIRFYCRVLATKAPQLGFLYAKAMDQAGFDVQVVPLGGIMAMDPPWSELLHLLRPRELSDSFINMVCAPPGFLLGEAMTGKDRAPPAFISDERDRASPEVVYAPETALRGLYTDGQVNIAAISPCGLIDPYELEALRRYDAIFCPSIDAVQFLDRQLTGTMTWTGSVCWVRPEWPADVKTYLDSFSK